jgi:hypothetical protein
MRFLRRSRLDAERKRELESYLEIETESNVARGMTPCEARTAAHRKLGNATLVREDIYRLNTVAFLETSWRDLRSGVRVIRASPGFALVAVLSLALGIGVNAALFQLLDGVRLRTLPVSHPEELVEVRIAPVEGGRSGQFHCRHPRLTTPLWTEIDTRQQVLSDLFAWGTTLFDLSSGGESQYAQGLWVSGGVVNGVGG